MRRIIVATMTAGFMTTGLASTAAMADGHLATQDKKLSYAAAFQFASRFKQSAEQEGVTLDMESVMQAVTDVMNNKQPALTQQQMQEAFQAHAASRQETMAASSSENIAKGDAYRMEYEKKEGVTKTPSGLLYSVITAGTGAKPGPDATVEVHYQGTTIDGEIFDSSVQRGVPATFGLKGIIKGWQEALQLMPEGSKWEVVIPPEIAYGDQGAGPKIGPGSTLIFEIELIKIK